MDGLSAGGGAAPAAPWGAEEGILAVLAGMGWAEVAGSVSGGRGLRGSGLLDCSWWSWEMPFGGLATAGGANSREVARGQLDGAEADRGSGRKADGMHKSNPGEGLAGWDGGCAALGAPAFSASEQRAASRQRERASARRDGRGSEEGDTGVRAGAS